MKVPFITTKDNPFDPYSEFDEWFAFDIEKNYNSLQLLDRILITSPDLGPAIYAEDKDKAIDSIIQMHPGSNYTKVYIDV